MMGMIWLMNESNIKLRMGFLLVVLKRPRRIIGREDDVGGWMPCTCTKARDHLSHVTQQAPPDALPCIQITNWYRHSHLIGDGNTM